VRDEITQIRLADLGGFGLERFRLESTEVQTPGIGRSGREDIQISVRQGLLAVSEMLDETDLGILVTLVDCPLINSDSIRHLLETAVRDCADIVIPERGGTDDACKQPVTGHPIFLSRRVVLGFDLADPKFSLRSFLKTCDVAEPSIAPEFRVIRMRTQDPAFFKDIDTPQDILSLHREHGLLVEIP
jgi:CTP:molybdopterin cytidylyltransferase MocA